MNARESIAYALEDRTRESVHTDKKARESIAWFVAHATLGDRYPVTQTYHGYVLAFYEHARKSTTIADAYVRSIDFAVKLLARFYFGVFDIETATFKEESARVVDILAFRDRVIRRNQ